MKIRNGFVSNSSSSSFIIGVKGEAKTVKDTKELWFDNQEHYFNDIVIETMLNDFKEVNINFDVLLQLVKNSTWEDISSFWESSSSIEKSIIREIAGEFEYEHKYGGVFNYSDGPARLFAKVNLEKEGISKDDKNYFQEYQKYSNLYFNQPKVKEDFIQEVVNWIEKMKGQNKYYQAEFDDSCELGSKIEHDFPWYLFPVYECFNHH